MAENTMRNWPAINAKAVSEECSPAHIRFLIEDAQRDIALLTEALTLAANRMDVMALEVIHENSARKYEWHEWAIAARAPIAKAHDEVLP